MFKIKLVIGTPLFSLVFSYVYCIIKNRGGAWHEENGFVTSALLYGILSLFLLLILGSLTVMTNRKLTDDQIRRSALDDVQTLTTDPACFTVSGNTITGYSDTCDKTVFIPETIGGVNITAIGSAAFQNKKLINITIKDNITSVDPRPLMVTME